jgi:hypothetical protein
MMREDILLSSSCMSRRWKQEVAENDWTIRNFTPCVVPFGKCQRAWCIGGSDAWD